MALNAKLRRYGGFERQIYEEMMRREIYLSVAYRHNSQSTRNVWNRLPQSQKMLH